ncbi:MAG TPA: hypothetical protein VMH87_10745 [Pseudomonadales bacterium]|nr:hypothetical protein [Pseudomonadales bacterium]
MPSFNEYYGHVQLPGGKSHNDSLRLDFNAHVDAQPEGARLEGFTLRLSVHGKNSPDGQTEMSIKLTPEQWLDLIDGMKAEFESVQKARKNFEDLR